MSDNQDNALDEFVDAKDPFTVATATMNAGVLDMILKQQSGFDLIVRDGFINIEYAL